MTPQPILSEMQTGRQRTELERMLDQRTQQLRELSSQLMQIQDEERRRIARELHDGAGQFVAALGMNLVPLQQTLETAIHAKREDEEYVTILTQCLIPVQDSMELIGKLSRELRTISHLLHPPLLDEVGLRSALEWYVEGFAARSGILVDLMLPTELRRWSREVETAVFRIVQEGLTNVHRHSGSRAARIEISQQDAGIEVLIADNGRGFNLRKFKTGVGIQSMKERASKLGGRLEIRSGARGTTVTVVFSTQVGSQAQSAAIA